MANSPQSLILDEQFHRSRMRLLHLERVAYWRGRLSRSDLTDTYDISGAQASNDIQNYLTLNPDALLYDLRKKRFFWNPKARPVLQRPDFDEAVRTLLEDGGYTTTGSLCHRLNYPVREASEAVSRTCMAAVLNRSVLTVKYASVSSERVARRRIAPHAFGHDGFRWHARAWCFENGDYRDFVLSRIMGVTAEESLAETLPEDADWNGTTTITACLNPDLPKDVQKSLIADYAMAKDGQLAWPTRASMAFYARRYLTTLASEVSTGKPPRRQMLPWFVNVA